MDVWEISASFTQFSCEHKTALKTIYVYVFMYVYMYV